ncbi:MAG: AAC(3) family N-acetyltransferase [Phycisphaerae bacterium]|nr:AAC(3) family N-acetyltransferase [Phycisphaerae bacterium]
MNQDQCIQTIAADLANLGILPGRTVLVHSSFKSLGPVPGGIETVLRGFLQAVGSEGTLLMPALSYTLQPSELFHPILTPSIVGAIPEYFRLREGTSRSIHPTHSVCAVGKRTRELLVDHALDSTPCGPGSPFRKIGETEGTIVMLGCSPRTNTTMHALEEYVEPDYLYGPDREYTITDHEERTYRKVYKTHGYHTHGYTHRFDRVMELETDSFLREGKVLQATTFVMDAPRLKDAVVRKLREDPYFFVDAVSA